MRSATASPAIASASRHPVARMIPPAATTASEPSASANECRRTPSRLRSRAVAAREHPGRRGVPGKAEEPDRKHPGTFDLRGVREAADRGDRDEDRDDDQREPVDQRGEHFGALEAEGAPAAARPRGQRGAHQPKRDRADVGEHVARVRQDGERPGDDAAHDRDGQHRDVDRERHPHPPPRVAAAGVQAVRVSVAAGAMRVSVGHSATVARAAASAHYLSPRAEEGALLRLRRHLLGAGTQGPQPRGVPAPGDPGRRRRLRGHPARRRRRPPRPRRRRPRSSSDRAWCPRSPPSWVSRLCDAQHHSRRRRRPGGQRGGRRPRHVPPRRRRQGAAAR